jgi:hypothetical protein
MDVDPANVAANIAAQERYARENAHWMNDKRCETGTVWHDGSCCHCGVDQGVACRLTPRR